MKRNTVVQLPKRRSKDEILEIAIRLFAERGFSAVSMRDLATACSITPAALYHHFSDKQTLYLEAAKAALKPKMGGLEVVLDKSTDLESMVRNFVKWFAELVATDEAFLRILSRELLENDPYRLARITETVLQPPIERLAELARGFLPDEDPYLIGFSVMSLVLGHYQLAPIRQHLAGSSGVELATQEIADHIIALLLGGIGSKPV